MARSKSSKQWLQEHFDDHYVKQAQRQGYRSRASFKLLDIQQTDRLIRPGMLVLDLGAAPGGWSQVAAELVGVAGRVIASDILAMDDLPGVEFVQGDFTEDAVFKYLRDMIGESAVDLVISDMAPNLSGMKEVDQPRALYLAELALDLAGQVLAPKGALLVKVFQGAGFDEMLESIRQRFDKTVVRKPRSSRARSAEVYILGSGFSGADVRCERP